MPKILNLTDKEKYERLKKQKMEWYYRNRSNRKNWKKRYRKVVEELKDYTFEKKYGCKKKYVIKQMKKIRIKKQSLDRLYQVYFCMINE